VLGHAHWKPSSMQTRAVVVIEAKLQGRNCGQYQVCFLPNFPTLFQPICCLHFRRCKDEEAANIAEVTAVMTATFLP